MRWLWLAGLGVMYAGVFLLVVGVVVFVIWPSQIAMSRHRGGVAPKGVD